MDHLLFCNNHPEKIAKRHCKKCDQNLCNDCVFESHVEHHTEIEKIEYSIDTKQVKYSEFLSKEINAIIEKTLKDLKPQLYKAILEKTEEFIKNHKNLQLKLNQPKDKKPIQPKTEKPVPVKNNSNTQENRETVKKNIVSNKINSNISQMAKIFEADKYQSHKIDKPDLSKMIKKVVGVQQMAKMFDQNNN